MIDVIKLLLVAGDGGRGRISFRRERRVPKGGPDGGDGGNGGHIIIRGDKHKTTLAHFFGKTHFTAERGGNGGKKKMRGRTGSSIELKVPVGTQILLCAENSVSHERRTRFGIDYKRRLGDVRREKYEIEAEGQQPEGRAPDVPQWTHTGAELDTQSFADAKTDDIVRNKKEYIVVKTIEADGDSLILCQGGFGGRGNDHFKGPERTTPLIAEYGTAGEVKAVLLELKLLADVGLVGYPNAGKSTLLGLLTKARSKIGAYPFTTLEPHLGTMLLDETTGRELVLADIPGLIAGASEGKGLGYQFLRHIENSRVLQYVLFLEETVLFDEAISDTERAQIAWEQYQSLVNELQSYDATLLQKPSIVTMNKSDLYSAELQAELLRIFAQHDIELHLFSGATSEGLDVVKQELRQLTAEPAA